MKKKIIFASLCICILVISMHGFATSVSDTAGRPGKSLPLLPPSHEIKESEEKIMVINQHIDLKQSQASALQPQLDKAKETWQNYHATHDGIPADKQTTATCESYYQTYVALNNQLSGLLDVIAELKIQKQYQKDLMDIKKQEFITGMTGKSLCANTLSISSSYDELMNCWKCFFDGDCRDLPPLPDDPRPPFVIVPNTGVSVSSSGAPGSFNVLSQQQRDNYNVYKQKEPPAVKSTPPQKGYIEQAAEKVRGYFQDVINKSQRIKNRVTTVLAVRG